MKLRHADTLGWLLGWVAAGIGLLYLGGLPGDLGHDVFGDALCGPWG